MKPIVLPTNSYHSGVRADSLSFRFPLRAFQKINCAEGRNSFLSLSLYFIFVVLLFRPFLSFLLVESGRVCFFSLSRPVSFSLSVSMSVSLSLSCFIFIYPHIYLSIIQTIYLSINLSLSFSSCLSFRYFISSSISCPPYAYIDALAPLAFFLSLSLSLCISFPFHSFFPFEQTREPQLQQTKRRQSKWFVKKERNITKGLEHPPILT